MVEICVSSFLVVVNLALLAFLAFPALSSSLFPLLALFLLSSPSLLSAATPPAQSGRNQFVSSTDVGADLAIDVLDHGKAVGDLVLADVAVFQMAMDGCLDLSWGYSPLHGHAQGLGDVLSGRATTFTKNGQDVFDVGQSDPVLVECTTAGAACPTWARALRRPRVPRHDLHA